MFGFIVVGDYQQGRGQNLDIREGAFGLSCSSSLEIPNGCLARGERSSTWPASSSILSLPASSSESPLCKHDVTGVLAGGLGLSRRKKLVPFRLNNRKEATGVNELPNLVFRSEAVLELDSEEYLRDICFKRLSLVESSGICIYSEAKTSIQYIERCKASQRHRTDNRSLKTAQALGIVLPRLRWTGS